MKFTLESNGLTVILHPMPNTHTVRAQLTYHFGSNVEDGNREKGIAHAVEHLIFKGTHDKTLISASTLHKHLPEFMHSTPDNDLPVERSAVEAYVTEHIEPEKQMECLTTCKALYLSESDIDSMGRKSGASMNAFTSLDKTSYYFQTGKGNIDPFLQIFANSAVNTSFKDEHIASEIKAILQEMKMGNDNPIRMAVQKSMQMLYGVNEPGHLSTIGSEMDLMQCCSSTVQRFYQRHYHPFRATLFVVGDFKQDEMKEKIQMYFSDIGVETYQAKQQLDAMEEKVFSEHPPTADALTAHLDPIIDGLRNTTFAADCRTRIHYLCRALQMGSKTPIQSLSPVPPVPTQKHERLYSHVSKPTFVFSFRIPGYKDTNLSYHTPAILERILSNGQCSRLTKAFLGKASGVETFTDRYHHAGGFFIVIEPMVGVSKQECMDILEETLQKAPTAEEYAAALAQLRSEHVAMKENVGAFTTEWVHQYLATQDHEHIFQDVTDLDLHQQVNDLCTGTLDTHTMNVVTIFPIDDNTKISNEVEARCKCRKKNARLIQQCQIRTTPIESPHSLAYLPPVRSLDADDIQFLQPFDTPLHDQTVAFLHPTSKQFCYHIGPDASKIRQLQLGRERFVHQLAANTFKHTPNQQDIHFFETRGVGYSVSPFGFSINAPFILQQDEQNEQNEQELAMAHLLRVSKMNWDMDPHVFNVQKQVLISQLKRQKDDAKALAVHELENRFLRTPMGLDYSIDEAIQTIQEATPAQAIECMQSSFENPNYLFIRPYMENVAPTATANVNQHQNTTKTKTKKIQIHSAMAPAPTTLHIPLQRAQVILVLARPSTLYATDDAYMPVTKLIYHICFHSLGSRIYRIREQTGLFYGAGGAFARGADAQRTGVDYMMTSVEPTDLEKCTEALQDMVSQLGQDPQIEQRELDAAKRWFENECIASISSPSDWASAYRAHEHIGIHTDFQEYMKQCIQRAKDMTVEDINTITKDLFSKPYDTIITVGADIGTGTGTGTQTQTGF